MNLYFVHSAKSAYSMHWQKGILYAKPHIHVKGHTLYAPLIALTIARSLFNGATSNPSRKAG